MTIKIDKVFLHARLIDFPKANSAIKRGIPVARRLFACNNQSRIINVLFSSRDYIAVTWNIENICKLH
jgi:hypothetical protein